MSSETYFLIPAAESYGGTRADLSFGLRRAARYYNEVVVPGIAGVWFVRQLSWATAALRLREKLAGGSRAPSAIRIANGIEALGCKLSWNGNRDDYHRKGVRAFGRNPDDWSFRLLSTQRGYVQTPYRMSTVRALPEEVGLGFAQGSTTLFNRMWLTKRGEELADSLLHGCRVGNAALESFLVGWIKGEREVGKYAPLPRLHEGLGPYVPTDEEKKTVLKALKTVATLPGDLPPDPDRRFRLVEYFSQPPTEPILDWIERRNSDHARQTKAACAFDSYREAIDSFYAECTGVIALHDRGLSLRECAAFQNITDLFDDLEDSARTFLTAAREGCEHPDALNSASAVLRDGTVGTLRNLVMMDDRILCLVDDKVCRGPLFRTMQETESQDDETDLKQQGTPDDLPHVKLIQLRSLLAGCGVTGGTR